MPRIVDHDARRDAIAAAACTAIARQGIDGVKLDPGRRRGRLHDGRDHPLLRRQGRGHAGRAGHAVRP